MRKTHDAELCERIRALEERVKELEARPFQTVYVNPPHWCYTGCPVHYPTTTWQTPQWTYTGISSGSATSGFITTTGTSD